MDPPHPSTSGAAQPPSKTVLDRAHRALGTLAAGPGHGGGPADRLMIHLHPAVQAALGAREAELVLPSGLISSIRRDQVVLDRHLEELRSFLARLE